MDSHSSRFFFFSFFFFFIWVLRPLQEYLTYIEIRGAIRKIVFLFLHKNICCGYSLEAPHMF